MKNLFIILTSLLFTYNLPAQFSFDYGFNFGLGHTKGNSDILSGTYTQECNDQLTNYTYRIYSAHEYTFSSVLDVFVRGEWNSLYVQGGVSYSFMSPEFIHKDVEIGGDSYGYEKGNMKIFQLHMPFLIGFGKKHFGIYVGPVFSSISSCDHISVNLDGEKYTLAYRVGGEMYIRDFILSVFMQNSITPLFDHAEYKGSHYDISFKTSQVFYNIGYFFNAKTHK